MLQLTDIQSDFLAHHNISLTDVLDARRMRTKAYTALMSSKGYRVAIGVTPCKAHGHTMRGANGHCVMCKPANLMYRKRYREAGYVYIASTEERDDIVKVGYCSKIKNREASLNQGRYGGYAGWKIIASREASEKGVIENAIHQKLKPFAFETTYFHDNQQQTASELFRVDSRYAISVLMDIETELSSEAEVKSSKATKQSHSSRGYRRKEKVEKSEPTINHCSGPSENSKQDRPASQIKPIREIDRRKQKETRAERRNRKAQQSSETDTYKQQKTPSSAATEHHRQSKPVTTASLRPQEPDKFDSRNSMREKEHDGLRWYHWLLIVFVAKCLFVLIRFGHLIFE